MLQGGYMWAERDSEPRTKLQARIAERRDRTIIRERRAEAKAQETFLKNKNFNDTYNLMNTELGERNNIVRDWSRTTSETIPYRLFECSQDETFARSDILCDAASQSPLHRLDLLITNQMEKETALLEAEVRAREDIAQQFKKGPKLSFFSRFSCCCASSTTVKQQPREPIKPAV